MASTYSALKLELIGTGDQSGTWGTTTNNNLGDAALGEAITGSQDINFSSADVTLTLTDTNASQPARHLRLNLTGTSGGARNLILGSGCQIEKLYLINNGLGDTVTVKNTSGTGVAVPAGKAMFVYNDGTNVNSATNYLAGAASSGANSDITSLSGLTTPLSVPQGGTGSASLTGVLKGNGTSAYTAATAGTDYLAPPSGTAILKANSGGALANATAGTDYVAPAAATTFTATQTFTGSTSVLAAVFQDAAEVTTVSATAATGTIDYDLSTQAVLYYTSNASANWTVNFRMSSGTSLNTAMSTGQSVTVAFLVAQGGTAYYNSSVQIDGTTSGVSTKWQGGTAPTSGNTSSIDVYQYTIVKTASATYTVFASQTKYA